MKKLLPLIPLAFALTAGPAAAEGGFHRYHSVAIGEENRHNYGVFFGAPDQNTANNWAKSECEQAAGARCKIFSTYDTWPKSCVAVSITKWEDPDDGFLGIKKGLVVGWGRSNKNEQRAKDQALAECQHGAAFKGAVGCSIQQAKCYD